MRIIFGLVALLVSFSLICQDNGCANQNAYYINEIQHKVDIVKPYESDKRVKHFIDHAHSFILQLDQLMEKNGCIDESLAQQLFDIERKFSLTKTFVSLILLGDRRSEILNSVRSAPQ